MTLKHEYVPGENGAVARLECPVEEASRLVCETEVSVVPPEGVLVLRPQVVVSGLGVSVVSNRVEVEEVGGSASPVVSGPPESVGNVVNGAGALFGVQDFVVGVLGVEGASEVQAGDRPAGITTSLDWNSVITSKSAPEEADFFCGGGGSEVADRGFAGGFVGDPLALERCATSAVLGTRLHPEKCPADSRVGVIEVPTDGKPELFFVYNVVPEAGYPAEFAFEVLETVIVLRPRCVAVGWWVCGECVGAVGAASGGNEVFGCAGDVLG